MPVFNNSENKVFTLIPPGDYIFCVTGFKSGISDHGKSAGSVTYELTLSIKLGQEVVEVRDTLIDSPTASWRIDTFLKCCGVQLNPGQAFEFDEEDAQRNGCKHVDPYGLCGWARITNKVGTKDPTKKFNELATYYTDKKKVQRVAVPKPIKQDPFGDKKIHNEDVPGAFDTW